MQTNDLALLSMSPISYRIKGSLTNNLAKYVNFSVIIKEGACSKAIITPPMMLDQTVIVESGIIRIYIGGFKSTRTEADCGKFRYEVRITDKEGVSFEPPPVFYYNNATAVLVLLSTDPIDTELSPYKVIVKGYQGIFTSAAVETSFKVFVTISCKATSVSPSLKSL